MEIMKRFWRWCKDNSVIIVFAIVCLLVFVGGFALVYRLLSPIQLSGFAKYSIIVIIDLLISIPIAFSIICQYFVFIEGIKKVWNQLKKDKLSVWNQFLSFIKNNAMIFALVLLYVMFYRFWETWIGNHIIDPFLRHFESNLQNDILFVIALIICIAIIYVKIKFLLAENIIKRVSQRTLTISIIAIIVWAYYRFHGICGLNDSAYYMSFKPLSILNSIKYFDIVPVFAIYNYMSYILWKQQNIDYSGPSFSDYQGLTRNLPINDKDKDVLDRDKFASSIVKELWFTNTLDSSFTCGIDAPWGSGKTSFINLMKNHLENNYHKIIIDFNPWLYAAEKDLVTAFFEELSKTLKQYDRSLARNLIDYSKLLSAFNTTETKLISSLLELVQHNDSSLEEKKRLVSSAIKRINKRIIVFIDDLDRLEANEILEMMKLIRNVSDFPYMYIIAAYDKSYVTKCLSTKLKSGTTNFIEKIFEHEHILAPCSNESLRRALADELRKIDYGNFLKPECEDYIMDHNNRALDALSNLREIYRLSNNIASTYSLLRYERVRGIDLLLLGLFKTKYPVAFSLFEHKWHEVLIPMEYGEYQYYELFQGKYKEGYFNFINYLANHQEEMSLNEFDIKTIQMILSELFMRPAERVVAYRINDVRWFNRYLNLTQLKSDIPEKEFNAVMSKPINDIKKAIDDWSVDKSVSLEFRLVNYGNNQKLNRDHIIKNIQAVLYASIKIMWTNYDDINIVISHLKRFNKGSFSEEDHTIILDQLKDNCYSGFMMGKYIGYLYVNEKYSEISLNETDLIQVQQHIFNACCKKFSGFISEEIVSIWKRVYVSNVIDTFKELLGRKYSDDFDNFNDNYAKSLVKSMRDFAKGHIDVFLQIIIGKDYINKGYYSFTEIIKFIWGSWEQFKDYLSSLDESNPLFTEFKAFYKKFEENNYEPVQFNFESFEI